MSVAQLVKTFPYRTVDFVIVKSSGPDIFLAVVVVVDVGARRS